MEKKGMSRTSITTLVVVVLLFGVVLTPCINASVIEQASDDDLIRITTEVYGTQGETAYTTEVTQQQASELTSLIESIESRLDRAKDRGEAFDIVHDALTSLMAYNLLPQEMGVEEIQQLITGDRFYESKRIKDLQRTDFFNERISDDKINNLMCIVAGKSNVFYFESPSSILIIILSLFFLSRAKDKWDQFLSELDLGPIVKRLLELILFVMAIPFLIPLLILLGVLHLQPVSILNSFSIERSSTAWIHTIGLFGAQSLSGDFTGRIVGFTGIKIYIPSKEEGFTLTGERFFYLGFALSANVQAAELLNFYKSI